MQAKTGNTTWVNEILPVIYDPKRRIVEVLLWLFHKPVLCCVIVGEFAMHVGGKLASHPDLITIYLAYHLQKLFHGISILFEIEQILAFSI